jgi:hypothetical protein
VSTATAPLEPFAVRYVSQAERTSWRDDMDILGIIGAVFQLIGDILGFVGSILNAIF